MSLQNLGRFGMLSAPCLYGSLTVQVTCLDYFSSRNSGGHADLRGASTLSIAAQVPLGPTRINTLLCFRAVRSIAHPSL